MISPGFMLKKMVRKMLMRMGTKDQMLEVRRGREEEKDEHEKGRKMIQVVRET